MKLTANQRKKSDESDDSLFYSNPKFAYHLDKNFRLRLTDQYRIYLNENMVILDLMSSWVSHLPNEIKFRKVIGHGLNEEELKSNNILNEFWVQDLNQEQSIPLENSSVDACLIVAGWQYLQYPELIVEELARVIKPNGLMIISFTNRAFWHKSPNIWVQSSEEGRVEYVRNILVDYFWEIIRISNQHTIKIPFLKFFNPYSDPFYSIVAKNCKKDDK